MKKFIIQLAYKTESSKLYHIFKNFLFNILENNETKHKKIFDLFMIFLVISTIGILIYEVKHELPAFIDIYELFAVIIFILEWFGRFIISFESHKQVIKDYEESQFLNIDYNLKSTIKTIINKKLEYVFSLSSIIDLLAILPSYRPLRVLRIFLLFRLFKVLRYSNSMHQITRVFVDKKLELSLLFMFYLLVIFFSATIFYIYEGNNLNEKITSFWDAIYWAFITLSTIGYGDITPISDVGRSVTVVLIIAGYIIVAFFTSIVTNAIAQRLHSIKENKTLSNIKKLNNFVLVCGYDNASKSLVEQLNNHQHDVVIIENNQDFIDENAYDYFNILNEDASNIDVLKKVGITKNIKSVVILNDDDTINISIILAIRSLNETVKITSICNTKQLQNKLLIAGANEIIDVNNISSHEAIGYIETPIVFEAINDLLIDAKGALMSEVEIFDNSTFINKKLESINFEQFNLNFIGIMRNKEFIFNPSYENTIIQSRDFLIIIGYERTISRFKTYISSKK